MITDPGNPLAIVLDADGNETGHIVPWMTGNAIRLAYQVDGYALQINGDDEPLCDFRRLPHRVWQSQAGQEIRVFESDAGVWQYSFAGLDISDSAGFNSEAEAIEAARAVDEHLPYKWSEDGDYPRWADLLAEEEGES